MKPSDLFVFGYFGYVSNQLDGQTVKTRMIHRLLEENTGKKISYYDTELLKKNKLSLMVSLFRIIRAKHIIYLPAQNNLRNFFPILYFLSRIFNFKIHYFVVGGWLTQFVVENKRIGRKLKNIAGIYVETRKMQEQLVKASFFANVIWFPNFRFKNTITLQKEPNSVKLKIVFLSRITKEKGIDLIFWFLESLSEDQSENLQIDFYGQVKKEEKEYFYEKIKNTKSASYKGVIEPENVQNVLSGYDLLVFPTKYAGEGCPGIIIDAYFAGLPVVATDWKYNSEFIVEGQTGFLFNPGDKLKFKEIILKILMNKDILRRMKMGAKEFSNNYDSIHAWEIIKSSLNF